MGARRLYSASGFRGGNSQAQNRVGFEHQCTLLWLWTRFSQYAGKEKSSPAAVIQKIQCHNISLIGVYSHMALRDCDAHCKEN